MTRPRRASRRASSRDSRRSRCSQVSPRPCTSPSPATTCRTGTTRPTAGWSPMALRRLRRRLLGPGQPAAARRLHDRAHVGARYATVNAPSVVPPGQTSTVTATLVNDGDYAMPQARFSLQAPAGWTVSSPAPVTIAPGQTVTEHFQVTVPASATPGSQTLTVSVSPLAGPGQAPRPASGSAVPAGWRRPPRWPSRTPRSPPPTTTPGSATTPTRPRRTTTATATASPPRRSPPGRRPRSPPGSR